MMARAKGQELLQTFFGATLYDSFGDNPFVSDGKPPGYDVWLQSVDPETIMEQDLEEIFVDFAQASCVAKSGTYGIKPAENMEDILYNLFAFVARLDKSKAEVIPIKNPVSVIKRKQDDLMVLKHLQTYLRMIPWQDNPTKDYQEKCADYLHELFLQVLLQSYYASRGYDIIPRIEKIETNKVIQYRTMKDKVTVLEENVAILATLEDAGITVFQFFNKLISKKSFTLEKSMQVFGVLMAQVMEVCTLLQYDDIIHGDLHLPNIAIDFSKPASRLYGSSLAFPQTVRVFDFDFTCFSPSYERGNVSKHFHPYHYGNISPVDKIVPAYTCGHSCQDPMLFFFTAFEFIFARWHYKNYIDYDVAKDVFQRYMIKPFSDHFDDLMDYLIRMTADAGDNENIAEEIIESSEGMKQENNEDKYFFVLNNIESMNLVIRQLYSEYYAGEYLGESQQLLTETDYYQNLAQWFTPHAIKKENYSHIPDFAKSIELILFINQ